MAAAVTIGEVLGAVPGVLALIGAGVGYGRLSQRVSDMERALDGSSGLTAKMTTVSTQVARMEEKQVATTRQLDTIDTKIDRLVDRLLDDNGHRPRSRV